MGLSDLRRDMVLAAIEEFDKLGREEFLEKYGYREARGYFLTYQGRRYDSKAIAGVAHRGVAGRPLRASEFSGGAATVARTLADLGFTVTTPEDFAAESPIEALLGKVMNLETAKSPRTKRPKRHQPLTLLWALGRAARAEPRLVPWETTRAEIGSLISTFGLVDDAPNPEYPVLKLAHFGLWQIAGHLAPPAASGGEPLRWMRRHQPLSGPRDWVYDLVTKDDAVRSRVAAFLLSEYLHDVDQNALLARVGLQAAPAGRRSTTVERIVRDTALSRLVKTLHDHTCQICGIRLMLPTGPYAEGCHIRPLGEPHNGPDELANMLCLCPNHHTLFDAGALAVQDDLIVVNRSTGAPVGALSVVAEHSIDPRHVSYHREAVAGGEAG
ncbi:HNH endonuclease [Microbispora sp. H10830]|uniref:HNH endonuclease n=1 Tax=Microbispora sp. H10830 TaxID=2729109 RepID=UPI001C7198F8|nr:HNH endonuclease [Microbispora sp. H10830]